MKTPGLAVFGIACFSFGIGTGALWMKASYPSEERELAELKEKPSWKSAERSSPAPSSSDRKRPPDNGEADRQKAIEQAKIAEARSLRVQELTKGAMQLDDEALREESIRRIREAMVSSDPETRLIALTAFVSLYELDFDKAAFRELILPDLRNGEEALRTKAWFALMMSGLKEEDASLMRQVAKNQGMGDSTTYLLYRMEKGDLTGESGEIVRSLLDPKDQRQSREAMRGTWGSKYSPQLESDLIALSRQQGFEHDTIYYALSTQQNKSEATVKRLIEAISQDGSSTAGRAAWGLQQGVSKELAPTVADAAAKIVSTRTSGYITEEAWTLLNRYAGPEQLPMLQQIAAKPNLPPQRRDQVDKLIARFNGTN